MGTKYTWEQARQIFLEHNYHLLTLSYCKNDVPMLCCNQEGYIGYLSLNNLLRGRGFKKFRVNNIPKEIILYNVYHFIHIYDIHATVLDIEMNQSRPRLTVQCQCGRIFYPQLGKFTSLQRQQHRCDKCSGKLSSLEYKTQRLLEDLNINYIAQYSFTDCVSSHGNVLKFDFYLPTYNYCIECDGQQHYRKEAFGVNNRSNYQIIKQHDAIKTYYCQTHNIGLLRMPYFWFNKTELYKQKLKQFLQQN